MQKFPFIGLFNQLYMFRATNSPILRSTFDCIYSFWYNAPTLLPTGDTVEMELTQTPSSKYVKNNLIKYFININC
jgi:hypothetical protein